MPPRRTRSRPQPPAPAARGITPADVDRAADALLREGQRPTIEKIRLKIGRGSPNTINPLLDAWWSRLAGRLDAGPAALHRLPEPVLHAAEGLWLQALDDARRRVAAESGQSKKKLDRDRQEIELHSHVLSIRENELQARIDAAERRAAKLDLEVESLTTLLRKEQASRLSAERQLTAARSAGKPRRTPRRRRTAPPRPSRKTVRPVAQRRSPAPRRAPSITRRTGRTGRRAAGKPATRSRRH